MLVLLLLRTSLAAWERAGYAGRAADHLPSAVAQILDLAAGDVAP
nr:hypothetical protein GCM10025730_14220 [Promicromonospora thailandica]